MNRILVMSDSHRSIDNCIRVLDNLIDVDMVIHLGDHVKDAEELSYIYPDIKFIKLRGNNDFDFTVPAEEVIEVAGVRIFCCHGHFYSKKALFNIAFDNDCQITLCGHTHISEKITENGITLLNPGSISKPRDGYFSYGVIEIENGKFGLDIIKGVKL